ncbi:MAG: ABC-2 family transporter protein [Candidatus Nanoarchaeia archaeon]
MSKFLGVARIEIKEMIAYKFEVLIWAILNPIIVGVYYFLWHAIYAYSEQTIIGGFTFEGLMCYYTLIFVVSIMTWTNVDQELAHRVRDGYLAVSLIRPLSIFKRFLYHKISGTAFAFAAQAIPLLVMGAVFFHLTTSATNLALFIISAILAMILMFTFVFFVGLSSFWLTQYSGVRMLRSGAVWFLSGNIIPLSFFPASWQAVSSVLPFQYMSYSPVQIFLGKYELAAALSVIAIQLTWLFIILGLTVLGWRTALKRFSAVGQ